MPNSPEDREEFPTDRKDEDGNREGEQLPGSVPDVPTFDDESAFEERRDDRRDDREREGIQLRARLDPTRYVL